MLKRKIVNKGSKRTFAKKRFSGTTICENCNKNNPKRQNPKYILFFLVFLTIAHLLLPLHKIFNNNPQWQQQPNIFHFTKFSSQSPTCLSVKLSKTTTTTTTTTTIKYILFSWFPQQSPTCCCLSILILRLATTLRQTKNHTTALITCRVRLVTKIYKKDFDCLFWKA